MHWLILSLVFAALLNKSVSILLYYQGAGGGLGDAGITFLPRDSPNTIFSTSGVHILRNYTIIILGIWFTVATEIMEQIENSFRSASAF